MIYADICKSTIFPCHALCNVICYISVNPCKRNSLPPDSTICALVSTALIIDVPVTYQQRFLDY